MKKLLCCLLVMLFTLSSFSISLAEIETVDQKTLLKDAVIYTLPMMIVKATEIKVTNTETASWTQAPINQLVKVPVLADAAAKDVVTPNVDTIYTQAMIDLLNDAVVLKLPKTDRFSIMQFMDAYTSTITIIDCTTFENASETFLLTGPFWQGEAPEGMTQVKCPSNMVWMLGRTLCADFEDSANVRAIQAQMDMYTLSAHLNGTADDKPKGEFVEAENFIPRNFVLSRTMEEYFDIANKLMLANPPLPLMLSSSPSWLPSMSAPEWNLIPLSSARRKRSPPCGLRILRLCLRRLPWTLHVSPSRTVPGR